MPNAPRFTVLSVELLERDVVLRMPFRFGVVTLTAAPQAFVRARIRLEDGREAAGAAAEVLAPKWFDKNPALSNEDNFEQLRNAQRVAASAYRAGGANTAFGHFRAHYAGQIETCAAQGLNSLVANYGPALIDRALLDALCRALGLSFYDAMRGNVAGIAPGDWLPEFEGFDFDAYLAGLRPAATIAARHTVGLVDPITAADQRERVGDGLPETLEEVVSTYGHRWFKIKVAGDVQGDLERLAAIAAVLDRGTAPYRATLDGNEQYEDMDSVVALWRAMNADPRLARLVGSVALVEQPLKRSVALDRKIEGIDRPVIVDESDDSLEVFPRARALGYSGVSSKTCKGLYKSILNSARCVLWNRQAGDARMFMSAEDLTIQAGVALQQDLALVNLLGITHVERNGHHYVNGMADLSEAEQQDFLDAHADLYTRKFGATRVRIVEGMLSIGSLACPGYAVAANPEWNTMKEIE